MIKTTRCDLELGATAAGGAIVRRISGSSILCAGSSLLPFSPSGTYSYGTHRSSHDGETAQSLHKVKASGFHTREPDEAVRAGI